MNVFLCLDNSIGPRDHERKQKNNLVTNLPIIIVYRFIITTCTMQ